MATVYLRLKLRLRERCMYRLTCQAAPRRRPRIMTFDSQLRNLLERWDSKITLVNEMSRYIDINVQIVNFETAPKGTPVLLTIILVLIELAPYCCSRRAQLELSSGWKLSGK